MHSDKYYTHRQRLFNFVEECVKEAQRNNVISVAKDPALVAKLFFFIYSASLRWWLATDKPKLATTIAELRPLFELQMSGLRPEDVSTIPQKSLPSAGTRPRKKQTTSINQLK